MVSHYEDFIQTIPKTKKAIHSALLVDASVLLTACYENPKAFRDLDPTRFQILDLVELGPSMADYRDRGIEELDRMFARDLEFLGADFVRADDGDEYWQIDLSDQKKKVRIETILSEIMNFTLFTH